MKGPNTSWYRASYRTTTTLALVACVLTFTSHTSRATQAQDTSIMVLNKGSNFTVPFMGQFNLKVNPITNLKSVQFTIQPKPGSVTRAISAIYSSEYLTRRGFLNSSGNVKVPLFGLYDNFTNSVILTYVFKDNSS